MFLVRNDLPAIPRAYLLIQRIAEFGLPGLVNQEYRFGVRNLVGKWSILISASGFLLCVCWRTKRDREYRNNEYGSSDLHWFAALGPGKA